MVEKEAAMGSTLGSTVSTLRRDAALFNLAKPTSRSCVHALLWL